MSKAQGKLDFSVHHPFKCFIFLKRNFFRDGMFQEHPMDQRSSIFNDFQKDILTIF